MNMEMQENTKLNNFKSRKEIKEKPVEKNPIKTDGLVDFNKIKETGNYTIDMVMSCIYFWRMKSRALKTIWLNTYHYNEFYLWSRREYEKRWKVGDPEIDDQTELCFDGVTIKKNEFQIGVSNQELEVTFWPETKDDK